jgi:hypothetical protein
MKKRHRALVRLFAGVILLVVATVGAPAAAQPSDEPQKTPAAAAEGSDPPAAAESSDPAAAGRPTHPWRTGGIVMTAFGGAGVVTAVALVVAYTAQVVAFDSCFDNCLHAARPDDTLLLGAVVSEVLGGGLVAGGIVLITRRGPPAKPGVSWMPRVIAIDKDRVQIGLQVAW